jgi:hypothetical protein
VLPTVRATPANSINIQVVQVPNISIENFLFLKFNFNLIEKNEDETDMFFIRCFRDGFGGSQFDRSPRHWYSNSTFNYLSRRKMLKFVFTILDGRVVTAAPTTSTTRDWAQVCADLCKTGDGGVLCNCELVPVRRR